MNPIRRWKSLSLKIQHLRLELEDRDDYLRKFEESFNKTVASLDLEDLNAEQPQPLFGDQIVLAQKPETEEIETSGPITGPEEIKKLWRLIAAISHPDKTGNDETKTRLYKQALQAWQTKSYDELYQIAVELGIEPPDCSDESIAILQSIALDLEKQIQTKQSCVLWSWGTGPDQQKQVIIDAYLKLRGKRRKITS